MKKPAKARRNKKLPREAGPSRIQKDAYFDPDVAERAVARAAGLGKSFSAYINDLVEADLAKA